MISNLSKKVVKLSGLVACLTALLFAPGEVKAAEVTEEETKEGESILLTGHPEGCLIELSSDPNLEQVRNPDGENYQMRLEKSFTFVDCQGIERTIPEGFITDGASIPRRFWEEIGSPFTGNYVDAAIAHDYCSQYFIGTSGDCNRMFGDVMLASGVEQSKANLMYAGVMLCGPNYVNDYSTGERVIFDSSIDCEDLKVWGSIGPVMVKYLMNKGNYTSFDEIDILLSEVDQSRTVRRIPVNRNR